MAKKRKTEKVAPAEPLKNGKPGSLADVSSSKLQDKASPPASKRKKTGKNSATPAPVDNNGSLILERPEE